VWFRALDGVLWFVAAVLPVLSVKSWERRLAGA
jgi:hypothetical protein